MQKILITGGIGSGKSFLAKIIANLGYSVFDADILAREVLFYTKIEEQIKNLLGPNVFLKKGVLNRELVRKIIYDDPLLKKKLELILHPAIEKELQIKIDSISTHSQNAWIFYEASLILEAGKKNYFDVCVVITAKQEVKLSRLSHSRNLSKEDLNKIIASQMPDEEKIKHADFVIENSGSFKDLEDSAFKLIHFLYSRSSQPSF